MGWTLNSAKTAKKSIMRVRISIGAVGHTLENGVGTYGGAVAKLIRERLGVNIKNIRVRRRLRKLRNEKLWASYSRRCDAM